MNNVIESIFISFFFSKRGQICQCKNDFESFIDDAFFWFHILKKIFTIIFSKTLTKSTGNSTFVHMGVIFLGKVSIWFLPTYFHLLVLHTFTDINLINVQSLFYGFFFHRYYIPSPANSGRITEILTKMIYHILNLQSTSAVNTW